MLDQEVVAVVHITNKEGLHDTHDAHVDLAGSTAMGWLLLSISCVRLAPQLISAFNCARGLRNEMHADGKIRAADHTAREILQPVVAKCDVAMEHLG